MAAAAALASAQNSQNLQSEEMSAVSLVTPTSTISSGVNPSELSASLLRHYSMFSPWKSTLLSSYTNAMLGLPHHQVNNRPQSLLPAATTAFHPEYAAALMSSLGNGTASQPMSRFPSNESSHGAIKSYSSPKGLSSPTKPVQPAFQSSPKQSSTSRSSVKSLSSNISQPSGGSNNGSGQQKTFPCTECGKVFNAHYNLTRHMPVHTGR